MNEGAEAYKAPSSASEIGKTRIHWDMASLLKPSLWIVRRY